MVKKSVIPIILAAVLSVCTNAAAFSIAAYAAEPAVEAGIGKTDDHNKWILWMVIMDLAMVSLSAAAAARLKENL